MVEEGTGAVFIRACDHTSTKLMSMCDIKIRCTLKERKTYRKTNRIDILRRFQIKFQDALDKIAAREPRHPLSR